MLLTHSFYYLFSRGIPGVVNFVALAVFTRLLSPEEYGRYALIITYVGLANVTLFQWLRLVVGRNLAARDSDRRDFASELLFLYSAVALIATAVGLLAVYMQPDTGWRRFIALATLLLLVQAWFELNLAVTQASLKPKLYGVMLGSKTVISVGIGALLALVGLGAAAPLIGLALAQVLAFLFAGRALWAGAFPRPPRREVLRSYLEYGVPLTAAFALGWVISGSDRILLTMLIGESANGVYAAGYDLAFQGLTLILVIVNTASYPLAVAALERSGVQAASHQLRLNGEAIFSLALTGAALLTVLGPHIIDVLLGPDFRAGAKLILPWIACATALAGIKAYYFDFAFQLARATRWQVLSVAVAAIANVGFNFMLIPVYGILGAAVSTCGAYAIALFISAATGRRQFPMPPLPPILIKSTLIAGVAAGAALIGVSVTSAALAALLNGGLLGICAFLAMAIALNLCECRTFIKLPERWTSQG